MLGGQIDHEFVRNYKDESRTGVDHALDGEERTLSFKYRVRHL